jgi:hypothetical protein
MNRRTFIQSTVGLITTSLIIKPQIKRKPTKEEIIKLIQKMMKDAMNEYQRELDMHLLNGIPYHYNNAATGTWLGFDRS